VYDVLHSACNRRVDITDGRIPSAAYPSAASGTDAGQTSRSALGLRSVTLITGDRLLVDENDNFVSITPAAGREDVGLRIESSDEHLYAIPADAEQLIARGTLDPQLFDLKALLDDGYDDAHRSGLPLLLGGTTSTSFSTTRLGTRPVPAGTVVKKKLSVVRGAAVEVNKKQAAGLWQTLTRPAASRAADGQRSAAAGVQKIWLDDKVKATLDQSVAQIGAPSAWAAGYTGEGVKVAVLDTGIDSSHPDLAGRVIAEANFTTTPDAGNHFGHGTHVASIIAGSGAASGGTFKGVAPDVSLLYGKVMNDSGSGDVSDILAGMQWAVDEGAKVVNMSLGATDGPEIDPLEDAVDTLSAQYGTLFVVSSGNEGEDGDSTVASPGSADAALTVCAIDGSDALASFSSTGPRVGDDAVKPDITAPGVNITAARAAGTSLCQTGCGPGDGPVDDNCTSLSGTSMAGPHVAGAAALLASEHPDWSGQQLKDALMASAKPSAVQGSFQQGAGRVDVAAAIEDRVTSEPASLSFGLSEYPHTDDAPVSKTLTYHNSGAEDLVLDLTASTTDRSGQPVDDGTFTVSPERVTVPADGTTTATVTSDTRVGSVNGQLSGTVTATTASAVVARTRLGTVREDEAFDLTLHHIWADGTVSSSGYADDSLLDVSTGGGTPGFDGDGPGSAVLRDGREPHAAHLPKRTIARFFNVAVFLAQVNHLADSHSAVPRRLRAEATGNRKDVSRPLPPPR